MRYYLHYWDRIFIVPYACVVRRIRIMAEKENSNDGLKLNLGGLYKYTYIRKYISRGLNVGH